MIPRLSLMMLATTLTAVAVAASVPRLADAAGRATAGVSPAGSAQPGEDPEAWAERQLSRLTLRQKVGQLFMPWVAGDYLAINSDDYERLREWVVEHGVGGIIVSIGAPLDVASKLNLVQQMADLPLLVAADMERGPGQRLTGGVALPWGLALGGATSFPPVMALGAAGDASLAYELGRITALEGRAAGVHMAFAPVADVNNNPANPIINTRSYGELPAAVAQLVAAHVRGLQDHGMLATAKHFPGHGDTEVDSHISLPVIHVDRARADAIELVPFRAAVDAGAAAIMSAHIAFPALTGDSVPATLAPAIMTGLLRDELGFDGLAVTDALDMGAIVERYGEGEAAVMALEAGADMLLMPPDLATAIDAVVSAVESGRVPESRVDRSVRRLLIAKARLGLHERRLVPLDSVPRIVAHPEHVARANEAAERGLTLVRDESGLLPLAGTRPAGLLSIVYMDALDPVTGRAFQRAIAERFPNTQAALLDARSHAGELQAVRTAARAADVVLFSPFVGVRAWQGHAAIAEPVAALVDELARERPVIVTSFGNPYLLLQFPAVGTYLLAWGSDNAAQRAAARAIAGEAAVAGRLPISLPPYHRAGEGIALQPRLARSDGPAEAPARAPDAEETELPEPPRPAVADVPRLTPREAGMDPDALRQVDSLIEDAIARRVTPGAAVAIGRRGGVVHLRGYGRLDWGAGAGPASDSTIYDVASLTKVLASATAVMLLEEAGLLDLDSPISRYLPEWDDRGSRGRVTVRQLLTHTSGLPAFGPLWRELRGREAFLERLAAMPLERAPGRRMVYSDYGMMVLALVAERVAGEPLDRFLEQRLFGPLGMRDTGFNPAGPPPEPAALRVIFTGTDGARPAVLDRIAPTEIDRTMRGVHVHGWVHDENAYAMGGVSGHAGLFSSARDLATFAWMMLRVGEAGGARLLDSATIARYTAPQFGAAHRALGWETPTPRSSAGRYFSARSFGHTGFTGTSIWIDPENDIFVVLLTNRVNPTRQQQGHIPLRRAVHDAVRRAVLDRPLTARPGAEVF